MMIISLASTKGGPGRTTIVACLADFFALEGYGVAILDTDPNQNMTNWHSKRCGDPFSGVSVRWQGDNDKIIDDAEMLAAEMDVVLIDVASASSRAILYAAGASDIVLIPSGTSEDDIFEAAKTRDIVVDAARRSRRGDIPHAALLSRIDPHTIVFTHSREQLQKQGLRTLASCLRHRTVYQKARFHGTTPLRFEPEGAGADDIRALGREVLGVVYPQKYKKTATSQ